MKYALKAFLLGAASVLLACQGAAAAERKWKILAGYDYYFPQDAGEGLKNQLNSESDALIAQGYDSTNFGVFTHGGSGARVGFLYPFSERTQLGAALGYVIGPTMNANFAAQSGFFGNGGLTVDRAVDYVRLLGNARVNLANAGRWGFDLDSAWGVGFGRVDQSCTASGSLTCPFTTTSKSWAGFTWEVSPTVTLRLKNATLTLAPRYAGFPKFNGNDQIPPIEWETFGIFFGAAF